MAFKTPISFRIKVNIKIWFVAAFLPLTALYSHRFDTYRSKNESHRLAKYVDAIEPGLILAMMVNDEGSNNLEDSAKKSIFRLGSQHISRLGFR